MWHTDLLEYDTCLVFDQLDEHFLFERVERDAFAAASCTSRTAGPVNVGLSVLGRLNLHDEVYTWDVKATGGYISGHKHAELLLLEALEGHFTLVLCDIAVHDFNVFLDFF